MSKEIKLGDRVKDEVTGFTGIAVARTKFLNGCIQYSVAGKLKTGEKPLEMGEPSFDQQNLKVVKKNAVHSSEYEDYYDEIARTLSGDEEKTTGGPTRYMRGMKGY